MENTTKLCTLKIILFLIPSDDKFLFWEEIESLYQRTDIWQWDNSTLWMEGNSQCAGTQPKSTEKILPLWGGLNVSQCSEWKTGAAPFAEEMSKGKGLMQHQTIWTESWLIKSWKFGDKKFCFDRSSLLSAQKKKREEEILVMNMLNLTFIYT